MNDNSGLLEFLAIAQDRIEHQHSILWKVETHYTWFVYVIAAALASLLLFPNLNLDWNFFKVLVTILGGLGMIMSCMGYYVVRLEGEYLRQNRNIYQKALGGLPGIKALHPYQEQESKEWLEVRVAANKSFLLLLISFLLHVFPMSLVYMVLCRRCSVKISGTRMFEKIRISVRDIFQITLLIAFFIFVAAIVFVYLPVANDLIPSIASPG